MDKPSMTTPGELLRAALVKEQQAHDFYNGALLHCKIEMVRELLEKLKDEESRHIHMIRNMLARLELG